MKKPEFDFDTWFDAIVGIVEAEAGVVFTDRDSVRDDYDEGRSAYDVAGEIVAEYLD